MLSPIDQYLEVLDRLKTCQLLSDIAKNLNILDYKS